MKDRTVIGSAVWQSHLRIVILTFNNGISISICIFIPPKKITQTKYIMKKLLSISFLILIFFSVAVKAQNPFVQTHYSPDPAPMVHNGTLYVYAGDDIPGFDFYYMTKWRVMSTNDMVNWTDYGVPISLDLSPWHSTAHGQLNVSNATANSTGISAPRQLKTNGCLAWRIR
jgi:hypothetical protein